MTHNFFFGEHRFVFSAESGGFDFGEAAKTVAIGAISPLAGAVRAIGKLSNKDEPAETPSKLAPLDKFSELTDVLRDASKTPAKAAEYLNGLVKRYGQATDQNVNNLVRLARVAGEQLIVHPSYSKGTPQGQALLASSIIRAFAEKAVDLLAALEGPRLKQEKAEQQRAAVVKQKVRGAASALKKVKGLAAGVAELSESAVQVKFNRMVNFLGRNGLALASDGFKKIFGQGADVGKPETVLAAVSRTQAEKLNPRITEYNKDKAPRDKIAQLNPDGEIGRLTLNALKKVGVSDDLKGDAVLVALGGKPTAGTKETAVAAVPTMGLKQPSELVETIDPNKLFKISGMAKGQEEIREIGGRLFVDQNVYQDKDGQYHLEDGAPLDAPVGVTVTFEKIDGTSAVATNFLAQREKRMTDEAIAATSAGKSQFEAAKAELTIPSKTKLMYVSPKDGSLQFSNFELKQGEKVGVLSQTDTAGNVYQIATLDGRIGYLMKPDSATVAVRAQPAATKTDAVADKSAKTSTDATGGPTA